MNELIPPKYKIRLVIILSVSVACAVPFLIQSKSLDDILVLLFLYGGAAYAPDFSIPLLVISLLPLLVTWYLLSDFLKYDFGRQAVYIFTRKDTRMRWFFRKIASLFLCIFIAQVGTALIIFFITRIMFGNLAASENGVTEVLTYIQVLSLSMLSTFAFLLLINLLSLKIDELQSVLIISFLYILCIFLVLADTEQMNSQLVHLLPSSQGVFTWHEDVVSLSLANKEEILYFVTPGFTLGYSYVYLAVITVIEIIIGIRIVKKIELV